ncbi:citrate lyase acyl carrier protein [Enterococcus rivorum]|uniref:Citrate lyase acyl carrier protein n=1 Tax=Enterococcus rivorum TaxID=762845 RepID=A0A1E5L081_9ENTE|nr:citrate lyase acyl carrier protein [Enterococcus rivorum]MBP2099155.1 citrate lyase subunit gamma (acyl carrier protein) [Enterococcus rivorum]OEH83517.1 citrate lyase acyl carrier protein [Enterococcus rivorum]
MIIKQSASAGTTESSDIMITIDKNENGIVIALESSVEKQFGRQIREKIRTTLNKLDITNAKIQAIDKGALDCTIQARTIAAAYRAAGEEQVDWQVIQTWLD